MNRWRKKPGDPQANRALVLLSGGLDSTAALLACIDRGYDCSAVGYDYCQPAATRERTAATTVAELAGVEFQHFALASAVLMMGLSRPDWSTGTGANMPGRNVILLSCAAALAAHGEGPCWLVFGPNMDDAMWHLDCQPHFVEAISQALALTHPHIEGVLAPWVETSKGHVARWLAKRHPEYIPLTSSCYLGKDCGECAACNARSSALRAIDGQL